MADAELTLSPPNQLFSGDDAHPEARRLTKTASITECFLFIVTAVW